MSEYKKTSFTGVEYREHKKRRHGPRPDRYYSIRYTIGSKVVRECLGWASEGMTPVKASKLRSMLRENMRTGEGPQTLAEIRQIATETREKERAEAARRKTFGEAAQIYLREYSLPNKASGKHDEARIRDYLQPAIGPLLLEDVTTYDVEKIKAEMQKSGRSASTVKQVLALIRQIYNYAKKRKWFTGDHPVKEVRMPKINNQRIRFLSEEEEVEFFAEAAKISTDLHDMCRVSLYSGLRMGEVFALQKLDIDLNERNILVRGLNHERGPKSGYNRVLPLSNVIAPILEQRCKMAASPDSLLFPKYDGTMRLETGSTFYTVIRHLGWNDSITDRRLKFVPHVFRHTFASRLVKAKVPLPVVQRLMGHSTIQMTLRYVQVSDDQNREAIDAL